VVRAQDLESEIQAGFDVANGTNLRTQVGFLARSAIIDNNTSAFAFYQPAGVYIPPHKGRAVSFPGTHEVALIWQAPPGVTQPAAITTEQAQVKVFASAIAPGAGLAADAQAGLQVVPNKAPMPFNLSPLAAGASSTIVAGVAGQTIYLFTLNFANTQLANFFGDFRDSNNNTIIPWTGGTGLNFQANSGIFNAAPLPAGAGLVVKNTGTAGGQILGSAVVSQG
jgi:hypothetical protein